MAADAVTPLSLDDSTSAAVAAAAAVPGASTAEVGGVQFLLLPSLTFVQSADGKLIPTLAPSQSQDGLNPLLVNASSSSSSTAAGVSPHSLSGIDPAQLQQLQLQQQQSQQQHPGVAGAELTTGGIVPSHFLASTPDGQRILVRADALTGAAAGDATTATLSAPNRVIPNHHLPEQQQPVLTYSDKERVALESLQLSHQESMPQLRAPDASAAVVDARMMAVVAADAAGSDAAAAAAVSTKDGVYGDAYSSGVHAHNSLPPAPVSPGSVAAASTEQAVAENVALLYAQLCKFPSTRVNEIRLSHAKNGAAPNRKLLNAQPKSVILKHQEFMEEVLHSVVQFAKGIPGGGRMAC